MLPKKQAFSAAVDKGYQSGYEQGLRDGACESLVRLIQPETPIIRNLSILYIPQGFQAIDQGIVEALRQSVRVVHVADAKQMAEQASLVRPDWVLVLNGLHVFPDHHLKQIDAIRAMGIRTAIWFADDPYVTEDTVTIAPRYDAVLTHELNTVQLYKRLGCQSVHYMPLAVHPGLFKPMRVEEKYRSDICFIGQAFWNRVELLDSLAPYLAGKRVFIAGGLWDRMKNYAKLKPFIRMGWLPVEESIQYYNGAKIVINMHRTTVAGIDNRNILNIPGLSINPRTYEISACGTLQITDQREDLPLYYQSGLELETFQSAEELRAKIEHYLSHEEERRTMALRGLRRTLRDHTFTTRIGQVAAVLNW